MNVRSKVVTNIDPTDADGYRRVLISAQQNEVTLGYIRICAYAFHKSSILGSSG